MELKCEFSYVARKTIQSYSCVVKEASITEPDTNIKEFIGEHRPGKSNEGVDAIDFQATTLHYFPRGLNKIFPSLKTLIINNCGLKSITRDDLHGLEKLEVLDLRLNQLQWLPSNLLDGMKNLKRVIFHSNKLECVSSKILSPIVRNHLEYVSFEANTKINNFFGPEYGATSKTVHELMEIIDKNCGKPDEVCGWL
jgi:Leucine-rich repeat (LRR) protein